MKKFISLMVITALLVSVLCSCGKTEKRNNQSSQKSRSISWSNYIPVPSSNVTDVYFTKLDSNRGWIKADENPTEATALSIDSMCPLCHSMSYTILEYKDLPEEKLGDKSIVIKKSISCSDWSNHADPFTGDYDAIIQLTLAE